MTPNLLAARTLRGFSQSELAARVPCQASEVSLWEASRRSPGIAALIRLADALDVDADYLIGRRSEPRPDDALACEISAYVSQLGEADRTLVKKFVGVLLDRREPRRTDVRQLIKDKIAGRTGTA